MSTCDHDYERVMSGEDSLGLTNIYHCKICKDSKTEYIENYFPTKEELDQELREAVIERRIREREARRDIRTLCYKCFMDMHNAGIKMERRGGKRSSCDKCSRQGSNWLVK